MLADATTLCPSAYVVDGDSLRCGRERLRSLGIDAPELHGCPPRRQCVAGDGKASRQSLVSAAVSMGPVRYRVVGRDRHGRSLVLAWAGGVNLACWQLQRSHAAYIARWDKWTDCSRLPLMTGMGGKRTLAL